jgi:hypothetical protein
VHTSFFTIVARRSAVEARQRLAPRGAASGEFIVWRCMSTADASHILKQLKRAGLAIASQTSDGDVAVVDMQRGLLTPCGWLQVHTTADGVEFEATQS